ncbi:MAG: hypothetical protein ACFFA3_06245 [Promethearchaeota archaeon]
MIFARAPVRICDIGGWTDTWFYQKGAVFNMAIALYSHVKISRTNSSKIKIISENLNLQTQINDIEKIQYDGNLDLLKAAVKRMDIEIGLDIFVRTEAPPGCGTGTSASVAVALLAALSHFSNKNLKPVEIATLAHKLETEELKLESGVQDQFAAAYGGINLMEITYPEVTMIPLDIKDSMIKNLEKHLILVFLNSRSSSEMHKAVINNYQKGHSTTLTSFETIKNCAYEMKEAIQNDDLNFIGEVMNKNWKAQKKLHKLMVNSVINKLEHIAIKNRALGFKLNGAGGGGSATILANIGEEYILKQELIKNGFQILPIRLDFMGVQTWVT